MSLFQASEEKSTASGSAYLQSPYLGPVKPVDFKREKVGSKENCFVAEMKLLGEDIEGNDVSGIVQNYVEWNPMDKDEDRQEKAINRLAYFASHLAPREDVLSIKAESWEEYVDKIIQVLRSANATDRDDIVMKFNGSVYQGTPSIGTVGYHAFIANDESDEPLMFTKKEKQGNQEYLQAVNSTPDSPDNSESVGDLGPADF